MNPLDFTMLDDPSLPRIFAQNSEAPKRSLNLENDSVDPADLIAEDMAIRALQRGNRKISLSSPLTADWGGFLTMDDYKAEALARDQGEKSSRTPNRLQKIRSIHHQVAIMLAGGTKAMEISRTLGLAPSRIYILQQDPAFQELLEAYKGASISESLDAQMRALGLGTLAMEQLMDKMLSETDEFSPSLLLKVATEMLDRSGYSPAAQARGKLNELLPSEDQIQALKQLERDKQVGTVVVRGGKDGSGA